MTEEVNYSHPIFEAFFKPEADCFVSYCQDMYVLNQQTREYIQVFAKRIANPVYRVNSLFFIDFPEVMKHAEELQKRVSEGQRIRELQIQGESIADSQNDLFYRHLHALEGPNSDIQLL